MNNSNQLYAWISETLSRFFSHASPVYFKIWNIVLAAIAVLPQIPAALALLNIHVPLVLAPALAKLITAAATGAFFMSKLTVKDPTMTVTGSNLTGQPVSEVIVNPSLPFTANKTATEPKPIASNLPYSGGQDTTAKTN